MTSFTSPSSSADPVFPIGENTAAVSDGNANCSVIEAILQSRSYTTLMHVHLLLLSIVLISIAVLIRQYQKRSILVHGNLLLIFVNIIALYFVHSLAWLAYWSRYRLLLFYYSDPCSLLTPFWMAALFYGPYYAYTVAFPALHFTATMERIRATFNVERYELEGRRLTICSLLTIWIISLGYMVYVICAALADPQEFGHPLAVVLLTSKFNARPILYLTMLTLVLVMFTALCDWRIFVLNRRERAIRMNANQYNLSRNYQLNENALTLRLILPLDISYALLYPSYIAIVLVIRAYKPVLGIVDYFFYYNLANTLLFLHSAVTIIVYIRFVKSAGQKQPLDDAKQSRELGKMYFKQLEAQWG